MADVSVEARRLISDLRKAAMQISNAGHLGWGNTCIDAAIMLEALSANNQERAEAGSVTLSEPDEIEVGNAIRDARLFEHPEARKDMRRVLSNFVRLRNVQAPLAATSSKPADGPVADLISAATTAAKVLRDVGKDLARHGRGSSDEDRAATMLEAALKTVSIQPTSGAAVKEERVDFEEIMRDTADYSPFQRLKFFCSQAMSGDDWLAAEPLFDAIDPEAPGNEQGRAAEGAVSDAELSKALDDYIAGNEPSMHEAMRKALTNFAIGRATQPPSASPVAVPEDPTEQAFLDAHHLRFCDRNIEAWTKKGDAEQVAWWTNWKAELQRRIATHPALPDAGLGATPAAPEIGLLFGIIDPDYARIFTKARILAWQYGYACVMHGSFTRDLDLLLVPWEARTVTSSVQPIINMLSEDCNLTIQHGSPEEKPHGRKTWTLLLPGFGERRWVDFSVMPTIAAIATKGQTS